jgi:hypothetical protein
MNQDSFLVYFIKSASLTSFFNNKYSMKTVFLVIPFALLSTNLQAQSFFTVGTNFTTYSNVYNFPFGKQKFENFKLSPSIGYGHNFEIKEKWSYQPGIYLGDIGAINTPGKPKTIYYIYAASVDQFLDYRPLSWLSVAISPSVYFVGYAGITGKTFNNEMVVTSWKLTGDLNRLVFSIVPRVSFHFKERWSMNLFYRNDLTSVGYPLFPPPGYEPFWFKGYGVGINLKYLLKSKNGDK